MRTDPSLMTLADWGRVLCLAATDAKPGDFQYVPLWVAAAALRATGFAHALGAVLQGIKDSKLTLKQRPLADELRTAEEWAQFTVPDSPDLSVLVLADQSSVATWMPTPRAKVLVLMPDEARAVFGQSPGLIDLTRHLDIQHLVVPGARFSDPVVQEMRKALESEAGRRQRPFTCWALGGPDPPAPVKSLKEQSDLNEVLTQLEQQTTATTVFGRSLGGSQQLMPPTLWEWLRLPYRRANGRVRVVYGGTVQSVLSGLLGGAGRLLRAWSPSDCEIDYEGAAAAPDPSGNPRETVRLTLRAQNGELVVSSLELVALPSSFVLKGDGYQSELEYIPSRQQMGLRFKAQSSPRWPLRVFGPVEAEWTVTLRPQQGGFTLEAGLAAIWPLRRLPLLRLIGDLVRQGKGQAAAHAP